MRATVPLCATFSAKTHTGNSGADNEIELSYHSFVYLTPQNYKITAFCLPLWALIRKIPYLMAKTGQNESNFHARIAAGQYLFVALQVQ